MPGPEDWLSRAGSQCVRCWERLLSPVRRRVAAHVRSVGHARVRCLVVLCCHPLLRCHSTLRWYCFVCQQLCFKVHTVKREAVIAGLASEGGVQKLMMPSLLFFDAFSDHACVFLCVSMYLEVELLTHEEIRTQCRMITQEWMTTQYNQASDTCMANRPNIRGNPTAHRTQPSLPASHALAPCARQPGFRARLQALLFALKSTLQ